MAGQRGVSVEVLERERVNIARAQFVAQRRVLGEPRRREHIVDLHGIVLDIKVQRVAGLVGRHRALEAQGEVHGLLVGPGGVEIDQVRDVRLDDLGFRGARLGEIDGDHRSGAGLGRRQLLNGPADPVRRRLLEIEIAIDAVDNATGAERLETRIDGLADRAKLDIGGIAERQHAVLDAIEPAKIGLHQLIVFFRGTRRRIAFAPGRRDHHQPPRFAERWQVEIGKIDNAWLETILARDLGKIAGETFGVPGLAREDDGQRLRRHRRRDRRWRDAGRRFNSGEKPRKPRALPIVGRTNDPVQQLDLFVTERCRLRDIRNAHRHEPWKTALLAFQIEGRFSSAQRSAKNKKKCMLRRAIVSRLFPPDDGARRDWPMPLRGKFGLDLEGIGELIPMPVPPAPPGAG